MPTPSREGVAWLRIPRDRCVKSDSCPLVLFLPSMWILPVLGECSARVGRTPSRATELLADAPRLEHLGEEHLSTLLPQAHRKLG